MSDGVAGGETQLPGAADTCHSTVVLPYHDPYPPSCVPLRKSCKLLFFYSSLGHFIFLCKPHEWLCMKIVFCAEFPTVKDVYYIFMKTLQ